MIINILKGLVFAVLGILLLLFPVESLYTVILYVGIAAVCYGVFSAAAFLISRSKEKKGREQNEKSRQRGKIFSLAIGILALAGGIVVLLRPELVAQFFPRLTGAAVLAAGVLCLVKAFGIRKENGAWKALIAISAATIILGGILLFRPFDEGTTVRILGSIMLYLGAGSMVSPD